ncbi:caspase family protein [Paenibacillus polymyxa]|jgi:hypothetical protein|uniref:caspase family protein n=1 Tax=Paenibacillus polymyxa TaxID=1406 RepID=UPI00083E67AF|nr:caspase family protein [Paenibacillus polymyxa]ODB65174.1 hypothetical protein A7309_08675 [Paenibacillus polymyxa]
MKKLALIVGINYPDTEFNLRGCINDAEGMLSKLLEFGFTTTDIQILIDKVATKKNILDGVDRLTQNLEKGDIGVFYYAGHGTQTADLPPIDEPDMLDEALVPYDAIKAVKDGEDEIEPANLLRDDEINERISLLNQDVHFVVIFDSCHSYTATHEISTKVRSIPLPEFAKKIKSMISEIPKSDRGLHPTVKMNHYLLAGCKSEQSSFDDGEHGYFTAELLKEMKPGRTYKELHDIIVPRIIERSNSSQEPQFEGPILDKKIFEG